MTREVPWPHPGEILQEEWLSPLGITPYALAKAINVPAPRVYAIVNRERAITSDTALRLAAFFGTDARSWMNLQADYDLARAHDEIGQQLDQIEPFAQAA
ncbi:HigA family addiction module antitoxin [uncultured Pseudacidovorax sp.]|uniref:HigA family addiction module antitoxin n=1 Tax=uncultured Pseudacidovorax sp. TaxID=679313 RepID=UPI0025FD8299|nr:HigA family addiction module antitoxin [uncultured Pseudacidovorax sp.]